MMEEQPKLSPAARLEALEKRFGDFFLDFVQLEAKVLTLDQVVGHLMLTGQKPSPEQVSGFWAKAGQQVMQKYPGIKVEPQAVRPTLFIPTNGAAHNIKLN